MGSLAENLEPPFYAAILNDNDLGLEDETHIGPTDEMVSLALRQPGFMGLETTRDDQGHWVAISYWRDKYDIEPWRSKGDSEIAKRFHNVRLQDACALRISRVDEKLRPDTSLKANLPAIPNSSLWTIGALLLAAFPAIAGLLGHE